MADFKKALELVLQNEGGWTVDQGGYTYRGISKNANPLWPGWAIISKWIAKNGVPKREWPFDVATDATLKNLAGEVYRTNYWNPIKGDDIKSQTVANFCFDFAVNSGRAKIIINRTLGLADLKTITGDSVRLLNEQPQKKYEALLQAREDYFIYLASLNTANKNSLTGWLNRLKKFPTTVEDIFKENPGGTLASLGALFFLHC